MPAQILGYAVDPELFLNKAKSAPDLTLTNILDSGAVVRDEDITTMISMGSNFYTVPYINNLDGVEQNYDGATDFTYDTLSGGSYSGVVYGRQKAWDAVSFAKDITGYADPVERMAVGYGRYLSKRLQDRVLKMLEVPFKITDPGFSNHTYDIATNTGTATDANLIGITTFNDAMTKSNGDNRSGYSLAFVHSTVFTRLSNLQLIEFAKYTDPSGITRDLRNMGYVNGLLVVQNDLLPVDNKITYALTADVALNPAKTYYTKAGDVYTAVAVPDVDDIATYYEQTDGPNEYTSYLLGRGAIRYAEAPVVGNPAVEIDRNPEKNGGMDMLYTRLRETLIPDGFSFIGSPGVSVEDSVLFAANSWKREMDEKSILITKIVTNG